MNAPIPSNYALTAIRTAARLASRDAEAIDRDIENRKASAMQDIVAGIQKDDEAANKIADEILCKMAPEDMAEIVRAAFGNERVKLHELVLAHANKALGVIAEIDAIKQSEDAQYA